MWPTNNSELRKQRPRDKSELLIADDMPNLQEVFMKNKNSVSVSNRRFNRQKDVTSLLTSQTVPVLDSNEPSTALRDN